MSVQRVLLFDHVNGKAEWVEYEPKAQYSPEAMSSDDREALERKVVGALRAAIKDHGAIHASNIGSAAKRIVGQITAEDSA